jgi:hypothetical protein
MADQSPSTPGTTRTARTTGTTARATSATKRSTAAKKGAATRSRQQAAAARRRSTAATKAAEARRELETKHPVERVQEYAERAILIPVGVVATARDKAFATLEELASSFSDREKAEKELVATRKRLEADLKRFERRGRTERNRVERRIKKTRARVERELRQRRNRAERELRATRKDVVAQADFLTARVENLVQTGITRGTQVATKVQERVAKVA